MEIQLVVRRVEVAHQVKHLFLHLIRTTVEFIYLVDDHDGFQTDLKCFLQHKTGLRHRTFKGIYQQQYTVCHVQHTFHFTSEISVPRSVNDVDFRAFVVDGNVLGQDRDTAFAFQIVVVQDQFFGLVTELRSLRLYHIGRVQHLIDQGGFSVVYVRNNCYVSNILHNTPNKIGCKENKIGCKDTKKKSYTQAHARFFLFCYFRFAKRV